MIFLLKVTIFAYTMLDVTGEVPASVEGKINAVDGVIRVRVINKK